MADEDEATAGLVGKSQKYPKIQAKPLDTSEYSETYRFQIWPPLASDENLTAAIQSWQDDARRAGLVPAKTAATQVTGEGGLMFIKVTGRVRKAVSKGT